jgi:hypothetical protein
MTLVKECVATSSYRTFDGECRAHLHVSLPDGPEKDAVEAQTCYNKCLAPGTFAAYESSGPPTYCEGMEPTYDYDSGALCLPREDCEALCDSLGAACNGIEMHVGLPRCYLIGPGCSPDDLVQEKKMDAFQHVYEYATKILEPVTFLTYSRSECKLDTELSDTQLLKLSTSSQAEADAIALLSENYCNKVCAAAVESTLGRVHR